MDRIKYYRTFNRENLLYITLYESIKLQNNHEIVEIYALFRFVRGINSENGRTYNNQDFITVKLSLFDLTALRYALKEAGENNGTSGYVKLSGKGNTKRIEIKNGYINAKEANRFIGLKFQTNELKALSYEMKVIADVGYRAIENRNKI